MLVYMHLCSISASVINKVWSRNKGTAVDQLEVIPIKDEDIEDGLQVLSRASLDLSVIWTCDLVSEVFLDCGM